MSCLSPPSPQSLIKPTPLALFAMATFTRSSVQHLLPYIEFPGMWKASAVENCKACLRILHGYGVQAAAGLLDILHHFEPRGNDTTRVPTIAEYPSRDDLLGSMRAVMLGLGILGLSADDQVRAIMRLLWEF